MCIYSQSEDIGECNNDNYYAPDFVDNVEELGWLGYYLGRNTNLNVLYLYENQTNMYDSGPFFEGLCCNNTIQKIHLDRFSLLEGRLL